MCRELHVDPRNRVRTGAVARVVIPGAMWQYGLVGLDGMPPGEDARETCSGSLARTSQ